jgi:hypothetical protein
MGTRERGTWGRTEVRRTREDARTVCPQTKSAEQRTRGSNRRTRTSSAPQTSASPPSAGTRVGRRMTESTGPTCTSNFAHMRGGLPTPAGGVAERLKVGAPPAVFAGVERDGTPIRFVVFSSPYHCGYGFASPPRVSGAAALFGLATPLAEPRLENRQTLTCCTEPRRTSHASVVDSNSRWWGGRAVEGTGLENRQTRQGLEGSNPSPTVSGAACKPAGLASTTAVRKARFVVRMREYG